jgi:hypothetical protein
MKKLDRIIQQEDDAELYREFEKRQVPERNFIYQTFFGGRFG